METANLYEDSMECVKAFHHWQLNVPLNCHVVPYDIWRAAWLACEQEHKKKTDELETKISALCLDLEIKEGLITSIDIPAKQE